MCVLLVYFNLKSVRAHSGTHAERVKYTNSTFRAIIPSEQNKRNDYTYIRVCIIMARKTKLRPKRGTNNWWIGELLVCPTDLWVYAWCAISILFQRSQNRTSGLWTKLNGPVFVHPFRYQWNEGEKEKETNVKRQG